MPVLQIFPAPATTSPKPGSVAATHHLEVTAGTRVLDAAMQQGVAIPTRCGGVMACLTCRVLHRSASADLSPPSAEERAHLKRLGAAPRERLACQARVLRDADIELLAATPETNAEW